MGWRISFGVGPLRYSGALTSRRRTTRRTYVGNGPVLPLPPADPSKIGGIGWFFIVVGVAGLVGVVALCIWFIVLAANS